jgi:hypothetical protein
MWYIVAFKYIMVYCGCLYIVIYVAVILIYVAVILIYVAVNVVNNEN